MIALALGIAIIRAACMLGFSGTFAIISVTSALGGEFDIAMLGICLAFVALYALGTLASERLLRDAYRRGAK